MKYINSNRYISTVNAPLAHTFSICLSLSIVIVLHFLSTIRLRVHLQKRIHMFAYLHAQRNRVNWELTTLRYIETIDDHRDSCNGDLKIKRIIR